MGLLKMFKSSSGSSKHPSSSTSASGSTSLPPTPLYPAQNSPAPSRSSDKRRIEVGAHPYEAMEQGRIPRAGPSARSASATVLPAIQPMEPLALRSNKSSAQSSASGRYEDPPESMHHVERERERPMHLLPPDGRIRQRASSELGSARQVDRSSFLLQEDLSRDYLASLSLLSASPPYLKVDLPPTVEEYHESLRGSRPPSPRRQRPPPLIDPASFRQDSSDTLPTTSRSRSPQPSLAQSDRQNSSSRSIKDEKDKPRRGMFGIKAFGRSEAKQASAMNRQLPAIPARRDSREHMISPPQGMRELPSQDQPLEAPPFRASVFDPSRRNSNPAGHARQNSDGDFAPPPPVFREVTSHSAPVSPRDVPSMHLPSSQPFPSRPIDLSSPDLPTPAASSARSASNGFPWLANATRSRSKSPGPSRAVSSTGLDTLGSSSYADSSAVETPASTANSSGILGHMPAFGKVRSRSRDMTSFATLGRRSEEKGKGKLEDANSPPTVIVPLPDADNDPSFQLRSFRHVSSGSGMDPGPEISYVPANPAPVKPRSTSRPTLSRPGSTMSMHDDSTDRKISVQKFRHSRRFSSNSVTGLGLEPSPKIMTDESESHEILLSPTETISFADQQNEAGQERPTRRESSVEMLVSPVKTRPAHATESGTDIRRSISDASSTTDDAVAQQPPRNSGFIVNGRKASRSSSRGPLSPTTPTTDLQRRPTVDKHRRPTLTLSPEQRKTQTETWCAPSSTRPGSDNIRDAVSQPSSPRAATSPREADARGGKRELPFAQTSPRRVTSPVRSVSPADSATSSQQRQRLPLHARLASVTSSTGPSAIPDPACEIPPVKAVPASPPVMSPPSTARSTSGNVPASRSPTAGPVKPPYPRSVSTASQSKSGAAKTTWDLSSSDEDDEISPADAQRLRRNFSKVRTSSMPSGLRRPPSTAEAFGNAGLPPAAPLKTKSVSSAALSSFVNPPAPRPVAAPVKTYQPGRPKAQSAGSKLAKAVATSSESEADSSSSEDEALSKVAQRKASNISLAAAAKKAPPPLSLPPMPSTMGRRKASSEEEASTSPTSSTRTTTPGKMTPLRSASGPIVRNAQLPPKLSMGPPIQPYGVPASAVSPLMAPPIRPFGYAPSGRLPRESPSSSQSGTGDTSSSGAPLTPRDGSSGSDIGVVSSNVTESGRTDGGKSIHDRGGRGRRVSFMDNDWSATSAVDAEAERKRKERRREEAKQAIELGNAFNGPSDRSAGNPPGVFNPYLGARQNSQPQLSAQLPQMPQMPQMDPQQMMQMQMQMQMNPAYMQMHQYAMMLAKQQYQASVAAAALQAANDEWERSSNMTGFGGGPSGFAMPQNGAMFGLPSFAGVQPGFPGAPSSAYGGGAPGSVVGGYGGGAPQNWATSSVYGESFGPPTMPRSSSAPKLQQYLTPPANNRQTSAAPSSSKRRDRLPSASMSMAPGQAMPKRSKSPDRERRAPESRPGGASPRNEGYTTGGVLPPSSWRGQ